MESEGAGAERVSDASGRRVLARYYLAATVLVSVGAPLAFVYYPACFVLVGAGALLYARADKLDDKPMDNWVAALYAARVSRRLAEEAAYRVRPYQALRLLAGVLGVLGFVILLLFVQ